MLTGKSEIDRCSAAGLVIWLTIQLAALGMCRAADHVVGPRSSSHGTTGSRGNAGRADRHFRPRFSPTSWAQLRATLLVVASGWPMALLAAQMSDASWAVLFRSEIYVSFWLISLHLWTQALPAPRAKLLATTIAATLSLGGPVLWYLRMEFSNDGQQPGSDSFPAFGPIAGAISQTFARFNFQSWIELTIIFCIGATAFKGAPGILRSSQLSRQVIH